MHIFPSARTFWLGVFFIHIHCTCADMCVCVCVYIYIYIYTYIHTYVYTCIPLDKLYFGLPMLLYGCFFGLVPQLNFCLYTLAFRGAEACSMLLGTLEDFPLKVLCMHICNVHRYVSMYGMFLGTLATF